MVVFVWLLACRSHGIGLIPSNVAQIPSSLGGGLGMGQTAWTSLGARALGFEI